MAVQVHLKGKKFAVPIYEGVRAEFVAIPGTSLVRLAVYDPEGNEVGAFLQPEIQGYTVDSDTGGPYVA